MRMSSSLLGATCAGALIAAAGCKTPQPAGRLRDADAEPAASSAEPAPFACTPGATVGKSQRYDCQVEGKTIHMVVQRGTFAENSRDNAQLFSAEIETGSLRQILDEVEAAIKDRTASEQDLVRSLLDCLNERLHESVSQEFATGVEAAYQG